MITFSFIRANEFGMLGAMDKLKPEDYLPLVKAAVQEDVGTGDITTLATIPEHAEARAMMVTREPMVVSGLDVAEAVFKELSPRVIMVPYSREGQAAGAGTELMSITGNARAILSGERTALNFIQRMSGVATLTAKYVEAIKGTEAKILDTRKTTPGWRKLEKYAVRCGGGQNHRQGLYDMILIKDNHLTALAESSSKPIAEAVQQSRLKFPNVKVEVEADTLEQVEDALSAGADIILLDNMSLEELRDAVKLVGKRAKTEASGGITLQTIRAVAETGVDYISSGALTHSARAVDIALDFVHLPKLKNHAHH